MYNEFIYLDLVPYKEIDEKEQKSAIVNKKDNKLEIKVKDVEKFNTLNIYSKEYGKLIKTKIFYGTTSRNQPITFYRCTINNTTFNSIPYSIITSQMYIIGNEVKDQIVHFTDKTKIRKIRYYNENIRHIFPNNTITIIQNKKTVKVEAKKKKAINLVHINFDNNTMTIKLVNSYKYNYKGIDNCLEIKPLSFFEIHFNKSVYLNEILKISQLIDSVIHLFLLTKDKCSELKLYDTKGTSYQFFNLLYNNKENKPPMFYLDKFENNITNFEKIMNLLISINDENSNSFFPFINYDRNVRSVEIEFLEYYRVLEYTNTESRKKQGMDKNSTFLLELLEKYKFVKERYFNSQSNIEIEREIRSLRNYYSHNGYYITELPVPTFNPKYYKKIDSQWLYDVKCFIKTIAYLEVYKLANINVDEKYIMSHIK